MQLIRSLDAPPSPCVLALGNFDGVHLGHQAVLAACAAQAKALGLPAAALSFSPHPREFFNPALKPLSLYPFRKKVELLRDSGMQRLYVLRFTANLAALSAQAFIEQIVLKQIGAQHVVTGENFAFGKGRLGNAVFLREAAERLGFGYTSVPGFHDAANKVVSSSRVRASLAEGDMRAAAALLGRDYTICGSVQRGEQRGRLLGFPTINLLPHSILLPRFGVYACRVRLENGSVVNGVANLGVRPTIGGSEPRLEAHLFDINADLYGQRVQVALLRYLREEHRFDSLEALKAQIAEDCTSAKHALSLPL